jgi:hypothetical protein
VSTSARHITMTTRQIAMRWRCPSWTVIRIMRRYNVRSTRAGGWKTASHLFSFRSVRGVEQAVWIE